MLEFKIIPAPFCEWDSFCSKYSDSIFHKTTWLNALRDGLQYHCMYYTLWDDKALVIGLPAFLMDYKIFRILYAAIPYGTIIGDYQALPYFLSALYNAMQRQRIHVLQLGGSYPGVPCLEIPGYTPKYQPVHLLSLQDTTEENVQDQYKPYTRRGIRRAARFGVKVKTIADRDEVEDFYVLYLDAMRRNQAMAKYPKRLMYSIYDALVTKGEGDIFFAKLDNKNIAGIMVLYSKDTAHYYFGGSRAEYQQYQPNEALFHTAIRHAVALKKSIFDFMGSDASDANLIHFKQKWGAIPHRTTHYTIVQNAFRHTLWTAGLRVLSSPWGTALTRRVQRLAARPDRG